MTRHILTKCGFIALLLVCCLMLSMCAQPSDAPQTDATESTVMTFPVYEEDLKIYWNVDREKYCAQSETILSLRKTNGDKKYEIRFALDGKQVTLLADKLDMTYRVDFQHAMGLVLNDKGEIEDVKTLSQCGLEVAANWSYVTDVSGSMITCNTASSGKGTQFKLDTKDCGVYDVSTADDNCGKQTQLRKGDQIYALRTKTGTLTHVFVIQRNDLGTDLNHVAHCVCGGTGAYGHTCTDQAEWIAWGDELSELDKLPTESGCYYLVKDVMLPERHTFPEGAEITICLNGKTIDGKNRLFGVYSKLNFCDCQYTQTENGYVYDGTVQMSYSASNASGGAFYVYKGCQINIYGGSYVATGVISNGSLVQTREGGEFNLYNGVFGGGEVINKGGILNMMDGGTVHLYGGEITGGEAGVGGGICLQKGTLIISGNVKIRDNQDSNLYLCEGTVVQLTGNLPADTQIGVTVENPGAPFAEGAEEGDAQRFVSDMPGYKVVWNAETKQLSLVKE